MADSYRLTVLKRLTAHLRGITKANGYDYDLIDPRSVCRGRLVFGDDDPLPLLSILEGTRGDIGSFAGHGEPQGISVIDGHLGGAGPANQGFTKLHATMMTVHNASFQGRGQKKEQGTSMKMGKKIHEEDAAFSNRRFTGTISSPLTPAAC